MTVTCSEKEIYIELGTELSSTMKERCNNRKERKAIYITCEMFIVEIHAGDLAHSYPEYTLYANTSFTQSHRRMTENA